MDTAARNATIMTWLPLVYRVARDLWRSDAMRARYGSMDDMIQVGCLGLLRAAEIYDPSRGVTFKSYAWASVHGLILSAARDLTTIHVPSYTQTALRAGKDTPCTRAAAKALGRCRLHWSHDLSTREHTDRAEAEEQDDQQQRLAGALVHLRRAERELLRDYYGIGTERLDGPQIAAKLGTTRQTVSSRLQKLRARLREMCGVG